MPPTKVLDVRISQLFGEDGCEAGASSGLWLYKMRALRRAIRGTRGRA